VLTGDSQEVRFDRLLGYEQQKDLLGYYLWPILADAASFEAACVTPHIHGIRVGVHT
jgi:hypothetical protein